MVKKSLQDLNLIDNFLFEEVLSYNEFSIEFCRILLSTILQKEFKNIKIIPQKNILGSLPGQHGIRLDAYIEADECISNENYDIANVEVKSSIYDIEPNTYKIKSEAKRTRYYHSLIDSKILNSGTDYHLLKDVIVIMILPYDPFGENRMVYTIKSTCIENSNIPYDDGLTTIFLYTQGTEGNPSQELKDMLNYMEHTNHKNANNDKLKAMQQHVEQIKQNGEVGVRYMKSWEYEAMIREESKLENSIEIAKNLLDVLDPATIAIKTGLSEDTVIELANNQSA